MTGSGHDTDRAPRHRGLLPRRQSRDRRFDGVFYTAVRTTGIYCRPSCPARTPAPGNVTFHPTAASAHAAGYRACKRCLPDATPGSPEWDVAADVAGRAMRLIADGLVDREGVDGLARRVGYTPRHLGRLLTQELGAGPLALARARRAQSARVLIETTDLPLTDVAFAAGFASVRQFNETLREIYASSPSELRGRRGGRPQRRRRHHAAARPHAVRRAARCSTSSPTTSCRASRSPDPAGTPARSTCPTAAAPSASSWPTSPTRPTAPAAGPASSPPSSGSRTCATPRPPASAYAACSTPTATRARWTTHLAADPVLGDLVRATPGLRVPGQVDGDETAIRTVIGQQVSVTGARTVAGRLVAEHGRPVESDVPGLTHLFPDAATLAAADPTTLPMPRARGRALVGLAAALADGGVAARPGPRPRRRTPCAAGAARHRPLDRGLRRDAGARTP